MAAQGDRPFVYVNMAVTVDGKITSARREYPEFTSDEDRRTMDRLRAEADALLLGAGTLRADNPKLWVRDAEMRAYRRSLGKPGLLAVVVSASLDIDDDSSFFDARDGGGRVIATVEGAPAERVRALAERVEVWPIGRGRVDLPALLRRLRSERGVERLLLEGGAELNWQFARDDLLDELYVTVAPALLGGRDAPTLLEGQGFGMGDRRRLTLVSVERRGSELYTRWKVER